MEKKCQERKLGRKELIKALQCIFKSTHTPSPSPPPCLRAALSVPAHQTGNRQAKHHRHRCSGASRAPRVTQREAQGRQRISSVPRQCVPGHKDFIPLPTAGQRSQQPVLVTSAVAGAANPAPRSIRTACTAPAPPPCKTQARHSAAAAGGNR